MSKNLLSLIFISAGLIMLVIGVVLFFRHRSLVARSRPARGVVTEIRTSRDDDGDETYAPVVAFTTETGIPAKYTSSLYSRPSSYKVGDQVEILYDPDKPSRAVIKGRALNLLPAFLLGGMGAIFFVVGAAFQLIPNS